MLQEDINKLTMHINEKEKNNDYNLNIIVSEFDSILSSCTSKDDVFSLKSFCDTIKGSTRIGSFLYGDFIQKVNEREESFAQIGTSKEENKEAKEPESKQVEQKRERSKLYKKDGNFELSSVYIDDTGIEFGSFELGLRCHYMQFGLALLEAKNKDKNVEEFAGKFLEYFDEALIQCKTTEDMQALRQLLEKMSQLGDAGKVAYNQFRNRISLQEKSRAQLREDERIVIGKLLEEYIEAYKKKMIDTEKLKSIYYRGQKALAMAEKRGVSVVGKLKDLKKYQEMTPEIIEKLDEDVFKDL